MTHRRTPTRRSLAAVIGAGVLLAAACGTTPSATLSAPAPTAAHSVSAAPLAPTVAPATDVPPAVPPAPSAAAPTAAAPPTAPTNAFELLARLVVAPEDTSHPYKRSEWGTSWPSEGRGCNTRELLLRDQGTGEQTTSDCQSVCPIDRPPCWTSPYDGFSTRDPRLLEVDHRVSTDEANRSGTSHWTKQHRKRFYRDTTNLIIVSERANASKQDRDPGRHWKPDNVDHWCTFASAYIQTKATYALTVDPTEKAELLTMLNTCQRGAP